MTGSRHVLDGAFVSLMPAAKAGPVGVAESVEFSRVSAEGEFVIEGVPPGEYVLKGHSVPSGAVEEIARTGRSAPLTRNDEGEFGSLPISVDGTDMSNLQIALTRGGRLLGKLEIEGNPHALRGRPVIIQAQPTSVTSFTPGNSDAVVDNDGHFEISGLAGEFVLRLAGDTGGATLLRVEADNHDVTDTGLIVNPGMDVTNVTVFLTTRPSALSGRVKDGIESNAPACWVIVFSVEPERWSWPASRYVKAAHVQPRGTYRVEGLPPGKYLAVAVGPIDEGQWLDVEYLKSLVGQAKSVELQKTDQKAMDLPPPRRTGSTPAG
jgi:hypothetical protein